MEVDIPQVNGFAVQSAFTDKDAAGNHVQFSSVAEVKTYKVVEHQQPLQPSQRPKHKARRRARVPNKIDIPDGEDSTICGEVGKPLSPSKLKKMMDKDRHSRTGRRGLPKKGMLHQCYVCYCIECGVLSLMCGGDPALLCMVFSVC